MHDTPSCYPLGMVLCVLDARGGCDYSGLFPHRVSVSNDLKYDSERDLRDIGAGKIEVHSLNKVSVACCFKRFLFFQILAFFMYGGTFTIPVSKNTSNWGVESWSNTLALLGCSGRGYEIF